MKKTRIFVLLFASAMFVYSQQNAPLGKEMEETGIPIDTCKSLFYLDGQRASAWSTLGQMEKGVVLYKAGYGDPKNAIFFFGEKARNGILIFETKDREDKKWNPKHKKE